jgi:hypothetical protein
MKSKVFVSCGQRPRERCVAQALGELLEKRGFSVYLAINAQTILEINAGIIGALKNSDCYLFVNFRRDPIDDKYRGSLFSNQELAIAYALGFQRILVVNQCGVLSEGMLRYIGINTEEFEGFDDCCAVVARALDRSGWTPDYIRRLSADSLHFSDELIRYGQLVGRFLYVDIRNGRSDIAALEATARLSEYGLRGEPLQPSLICSPLKATARPGFSHTIFPQSHEAFDLLCVGTCPRPVEPGWNVPATSGAFEGPPNAPVDHGVYLNSALDVVGAGRLPIDTGTWTLRYEFYAIGFPLLSVSIELRLTDWNQPAATIVSQEVG